MLNQFQINSLLEGEALLECFGNLYEFCGMEGGKYVFQSVNDDYHITVSYENLIRMPEYDIQY